MIGGEQNLSQSGVYVVWQTCDEPQPEADSGYV